MVRDASKSFHKRQRQFCGKRKMLFIVAERGEIPMSLQLKPSTDGRVPLEDHVGSNLARFPWKIFPKCPQGLRESLTGQGIAPPALLFRHEALGLLLNLQSREAQSVVGAV